MLLSPRLQKLHVHSLVVLHWMVFLKTRPSVKGDNAEFTNVSSFTSLLMCSTHFTPSCGYFLFPSPSPKIFSSLYILKSLESLPGRSCLGPLGVVCFSGNWRSSELDSLQFWTSDIQDLPTSWRKFLYFTFLFIFSILYIKKCVEESKVWQIQYHFFRPFYSFPQNWVITEVLSALSMPFMNLLYWITA